MDIIMSDEVVDWFKQEYDITGKQTLRFFVRYGGLGGNIPAFSLGVNIESPNDLHTATTVDDITFYVEEADAWYFEDKDLVVSLNEKLSEPIFEYKKQ